MLALLVEQGSHQSSLSARHKKARVNGLFYVWRWMQSDANSSPEKSLINGKIQGKNLFIKLIFKYSEIINARSLTEMKSILVRKIVTGIYQGLQEYYLERSLWKIFDEQQKSTQWFCIYIVKS
ncbi:MAG: hypothetical protein ACYTBY_00680 [Planctomycetota bacterium]